MSSGDWRTEKRKDISSNGKKVTQKVMEYLALWEGRCYYSGIPDEVPTEIMRAGKAPSYKTIAIAILNNDYKALGIYADEPDWVGEIVKKGKDNEQGSLF